MIILCAQTIKNKKNQNGSIQLNQLQPAISTRAKEPFKQNNSVTINKLTNRQTKKPNIWQYFLELKNKDNKNNSHLCDWSRKTKQTQKKQTKQTLVL